MNIEEVSKEVLYDWEQKVSDKWLKRNKARGEAQRSANSVPIIGAIYQVILIIFSAILYVLYKQQLQNRSSPTRFLNKRVPRSVDAQGKYM